MFDPTRVTTVTFDSYTTLVDVDAQEPVLADRLGVADPEPISRLWRGQTMTYSVVANDVDAYRPFDDLLELGLEYALARYGVETTEAERRAVVRAVYEDEPAVFDDVRAGMERLRGAGYDVYVVSNGTPAMLAHLVERAGVEDLVADVVSADEVETYKPDPEIYRHAAARTGTPIREVLHVSGGSMRDVWGAMHAGMQAAWLRRDAEARPRERLAADPDVTVGSIPAVAEELAGS